MKQTLSILILLLLSQPLASSAADQVHRPVIDGRWWQVAGDPDLGEFTREKQQPVDFGVWQAADGTWQLWSCIRHTACGGNMRLFYRWEGNNLTDNDWKPMGIAQTARTDKRRPLNRFCKKPPPCNLTFVHIKTP